jgi:hypothetical protein
MPLGPNDPVPAPCPTCGHLAMQHTRTPAGKRCIGNQWRCKCVLRPLSMVMTLPALRRPEVARTPPPSR